uniref:DNA/RNA non-specific endonuclease n=1 Tax=Tribolium castaneum TaxID=7070 RepID=A0A7D3SQ59_TRICA|nr:DNA/RNA non-specific endonuclease [Tribolium castaneum]
MLLPALFLLLQVSLGDFFILRAPDCNIQISNLDPEPIVVDGTYTFLYAAPDASSVLVKSGETIIISCPGGEITVGSTSFNSTVSATCVSNSDFSVGSATINFNQIVCSWNPFHTARYTGKSCEKQGKEIEVGFVINENFAREITICFDNANLNTLYSSYEITKSMGHHESGVSRPFFIEDDFYNLDVKVNSLYVRGGQRTTINSLLGLPADSTKYIQDGNDFYLARGHFAAKADFVYAPQQTATFHYVNVAPQWQSFNGYNWNQVESDVRDYAEKNGIDLKMYTGTYGVTTLPHEETGEETPLYLYIGSNGIQGIAVPELYWKVAYNPETQLGVALLGINNPYQKDINKSIICEDVSAKINWLHWNASDTKAGYSYACEVDAFRKRVTYLPDFVVKGLLL